MNANFSLFGRGLWQWAALSLLTVAGSVASGQALSQAGTAQSAMRWIQRWQDAVARHPYAGTVTIMQERGGLRSARVWHGVQAGQQIDRIDMLSGSPRTILRSGQEVVIVQEGKSRRVRSRSEDHWMGSPFAVGGQLDHAQLRHASQYYRVVPLGQQRVANYQTDVIGFLPTDNLRAPYRFWTEQKSGLLLKWQMLAMHPAAPQAWDRAQVLRDVAFSDVQVPAPVDFSVLQGMLAQFSVVEKQESLRAGASSPTSLQEQGWIWRQSLPGYIVKSCYWRDLAGMQPRGSRPVPRQAGGQRVLQCLVTDGLSRFSLFIGPYQASRPVPHRRQPAGGSMRVASRSYGNAYQLTAVGAVPQAVLQQAVSALYRH